MVMSGITVKMETSCNVDVRHHHHHITTKILLKLCSYYSHNILSLSH